MEKENQIVMKSKVKGSFNFTKQKGEVNADSDVEGNCNYTNQELLNEKKNVVSWWTKTHVFCVVITTIITILGFLFTYSWIKQ